MALDPLLARLLPRFVGEAEDLVQQVTVSLLSLERGPDRASAEAALRALHTLKGSAATLGLEAPAQLAHELEDALGPFVDATVPPAVLDGVLGALDALMGHVRAVAAGQGAPALDEVQRRLAASVAAAGGASDAPDDPPAPAPTPAARDEAAAAATASAAAEDVWRVQAADVEALSREVERLRELRLRLDARRAVVERALGALDALGAAAGEVRLQLSTLRRGLLGDGDDAAALVSDFEQAVRAVSTLPARTLLEPLQRAVRDLCRRGAKSARLSVVGDDVALERRLLAPLSTALVHLVRNAVDHGIEAPEVREARGKDAEGLITVRLERQGNALHIEVVDDGGGIDAASVRAAAARAGVAAPEVLAAMSDDEARRLIFEPRLSTRTEADETSGRGVGLDAVREQVLALRGHIGIETRPGQGTTFQVTLPIDLGGTPILIAVVGEHRIGLPLSLVEGVGRLRESHLTGGAQPLLRVGDALLDIHDLGGLLGVRRHLPARPGWQHVVIHGQGRRAALLVDHVAGHDDLVMRPLPEELGPMPAYQGAAVLAQGELLPVLRPSWVLEQLAADATAGEQEVGAPRALVVDDALTARALHRAALEAAGWAVFLASSTRQALDRLSEGRVDVLVTDLRLGEGGDDGLALLTAARARSAGLPVVVVSAQDDDATRRRVLAAGADAFVAKRDCARGALAAEVAAAVARRRALSGAR